jgi:hypothetical protein
MGTYNSKNPLYNIGTVDFFLDECTRSHKGLCNL